MHFFEKLVIYIYFFENAMSKYSSFVCLILTLHINSFLFASMS